MIEFEFVLVFVFVMLAILQVWRRDTTRYVSTFRVRETEWSGVMAA